MARKAILPALLATATPAAAQLSPVDAPEGMRLHTAPAHTLSPSGTQRTLDWRGWRATTSFTLPPDLDADNLRIVLSGEPGAEAPAPHASIAVRLNGSPAAVLRPEPYPFAAQVDFPAQYLRSGENTAVIEFLSPENDCPNPSDGAWLLDLSVSQVELTARPAEPVTPQELGALLRSELMAPRRIAIQTPGADPADRAMLQAWAAMALALPAPRTPDFVLDGGAADLSVRFILDPEVEQARFKLVPGAPTVLEVHAADADAAARKLKSYAAEIQPDRAFMLPAFDETWSPEPAEAHFTLDERPAKAFVRMDVVRSADTTDDSRLTVLLNGRALEAVDLSHPQQETAVELPAYLLRPGQNRLTFRPALAPTDQAALCPAERNPPRIDITAMRLDMRDAHAPAPGLFGFAAGDLGDGADLALPARNDQDRAAQLRLLAELARRAGEAPQIGRILPQIDAAASDRPLTIIAPRTTIPDEILAHAPESLFAVLRGPRSQPTFRIGPPRAAAAPLDPDAIRGGAARFDLSGDGSGATILITEAEGADFAATLSVLIDAGMLDRFDGRVMRWTAEEAMVQDRGPWFRPGGAMIPPPRDGELRRTLLFLAIVGGLSLGLVMARAQRRQSRPQPG